MRKPLYLCLIAALGLSGCGGSSDSLTGSTPPPGAGPGDPILASLEIITSSPQVPSDGGIPAELTAFLRDDQNNFVSGQTVTFSADSGGIVINQSETDANGVASASLSTAGDPTNRQITVTAQAGTLMDTVTVNVVGSQLTVSGPGSLVLGDTATYTFVLSDAAGAGIASQMLDVTSQNQLSATTLTTDATGQVQVDVTATTSGNDNLTATGLGLSATRVISVSGDDFAFTTPAADTEIPLNTPQTVTVQWLQNNMPQVGVNVQFSTTRGTIITNSSVATDNTGSASIQVQSSNAGPAVITAAATGGPTAQRSFEFVATQPARLEIQADPFVVAPGNQSTVTAVVRDANNNLVKNATVDFQLEDITGGSLSVGTAETDSQGRAQTFYTAAATVSDDQGVTVRAFVRGTDPNDCDNQPLCNAAQLTVARRSLFIAFGTGNELAEPDEATYEATFLIFVTDSNGFSVPNANVQLQVRSIVYNKGVWLVDPATSWFTFVRATCEDEDLNNNGILDDGEIDANNNGTIEAGNIATVVPGEGTTDSEGRLLFVLRYPQVYGAWTQVRVRALASVSGTEFAESQDFILSVTADDVVPDGSPPGLAKPPDAAELNLPPAVGFTDTDSFLSSPWGYGNDCSKDF